MDIGRVNKCKNISLSPSNWGLRLKLDPDTSKLPALAWHLQGNREVVKKVEKPFRFVAVVLLLPGEGGT